MKIGLCILELYFPYSHSLKEKRSKVNRIKERIKARFNVAIAEIGYQELWQRTKIGLVTIANGKDIVEKTFHLISRFVEAELGENVTNIEIEVM
ncbi:MAG: DUF503 domain-containing protein [Candidatus Aminicenantia bacterium]